MENKNITTAQENEMYDKMYAEWLETQGVMELPDTLEWGLR